MSRKRNNIIEMKVDVEPTLKSVPMFTTDEVEIKLNSVLYRPRWSSGYNFNKEADGEVEVLRVFFVNNTARTFRTKCIRGCEEVFKVGDGCRHSNIYNDAGKAFAELQEKAEQDIAKCIAKQKSVKATIETIQDKVEKIRSAKLKIPKAVKC